MLLQYIYRGNQSSIIANWTDENGQSCVYQDIVRKLEAKHGEAFAAFFEVAREIDGTVDKLYDQIYIYGNEYHALPYDPRDRKRFVKAFTDVCEAMADHIQADHSEEEAVLAILFLSILDKLQEITSIYLLDTAYLKKHRRRYAELRKLAAVTVENEMAYQFEDVLLQLTDVNNVLERLTEKERRRLVKHLFLKNTFQEIADQEGVRKQSVEESVSTALEKIRNILGDK